MDILTVRGLTRRFGELVVLDDVHFGLAAGRLAVVAGPNGSGKTTLLRCVVGSDRPDEGEVLIDGKPCHETDPEVRAVLAAALDDIDFFPDLSVTEHLELVAYAHGGTAQPVAEILAELDLERVADQLPVTLSSGQRQRLTLASCFVRPRRLLVLDEPEQRLDGRGRAWLADRLLREKAAGTAVLMASHDADLIAKVADDRIEVGG
ncbi:ABC transporter ATP-binding protein [Micromonospora siamensis]|uniref:ABC transporter n=1 Tax=Micromonospora siamensis TaxID=299152 RepID=A0A1C5HDJ3_9ACTN|nr:ABC transporter ATP-binding protein [Micromonospora siamensis]SCG44075.1 ABC transporter [Micromonospora siamensis]